MSNGGCEWGLYVEGTGSALVDAEVDPESTVVAGMVEGTEGSGVVDDIELPVSWGTVPEDDAGGGVGGGGGVGFGVYPGPLAGSLGCARLTLRAFDGSDI